MTEEVEVVQAEEETILEKAIDFVKDAFTGATSLDEIVENIADEATDFGAGHVADMIEEKFGDSELGMAGAQGVMMGFINDFYPRLVEENKEEVLARLGLSEIEG